MNRIENKILDREMQTQHNFRSRSDNDLILFKNSKKGIISFNFVYFIPRILFLLVMLLAVVILVRLFISDKFDTYDARAEILINGMLYGSGGISQYDPITGRYNPQIIDLNQLDQIDIDRVFYTPDNRYLSAKIIISDNKDSEKEGLKTLYYNKEWYDNWQPLLKIVLVGGVKEYKQTLPIIYIKGDEQDQKKTGFIHFQVIQPK